MSHSGAARNARGNGDLDGTASNATESVSMKAAIPIRIGTAGWSLPRTTGSAFPDTGSHLQRYAAVFNAAEINSSFYRQHKRETYARWASVVPHDFRFSVKLARDITHTLRLRACEARLKIFLDEIEGLGSTLGCVLIQLPPSLAFEKIDRDEILTMFRDHFDGGAVLEPRHVTWFEPVVENLLREMKVGRVGSDPSICPAAATPMAHARIGYRRLHGSPRIYYSNYDDIFLESVAADLTECHAQARDCWCIFDNTAHGFATANALRLAELLRIRR